MVKADKSLKKTEPATNQRESTVSPYKKIFLVAASAAVISACTTERQIRGFVMDDELISAVTVGLDNQFSVNDMLGNPSVRGTFDNKVWYYINSQTSKRSFLEERPYRQDIVAIVFDDSGTVSEVRRYTLADAKDVNFSDDETPTRGKTLGFWEQIFGNIGRFAGQGAPPLGPGGPNTPN